MKPLVVIIGLLALAGVGCRNETKPSATDSAANPSSSVSTSTPAAPDAVTAESLVTMDCLPCHDELMLAQQRLTPKQWAAVVKKMQGWGSIIPPENVDMVVDYLAKRYPADGKPYEIPTVSTNAVAVRFSKSADGVYAGGDVRRGETLFKETCAACHGPEAKGALVGVALAHRSILDHPSEFAEMVRKGRGRMMGVPTLKDSDIAALLAFLRGSTSK